MEDYVATDIRPVTKCLEDVARADLYIGIFAHRYGHVPAADNLTRTSITEMEYRHAVQQGKVCLIFLHNDEDQWPPKFVESGDRESGKRMRALRDELTQELLVSFFTNADNLAALVVAAVRNYEETTKIDSSNSDHHKIHLSLPNIRRLTSSLPTKDSFLEQVNDVLRQITNLLQLALQIFIASTIRSYESVIVDEPREYSKKVRPIKKILADKFATPSLLTFYDLAEQCFHLVGAEAHNELIAMKSELAADFALGDIGLFLDTCESLIPSGREKPRFVNKPSLRRSLISFVIPELCKYLAKIDHLVKAEESTNLFDDSTVSVSLRCLESLTERLTPLLSQTYVVESLESIDSTDRKYTLLERSYKNNSVSLARRQVSFEELEHYQGDVAQILGTRNGAPVKFRLAPFLIIRDDSLCIYRRTRAVGYEYHSVSLDRPCIERTKRKFSHSLFRQGIKGTEQALFFTEVIPAVNELSGVRSNIPSQGPIDFVGRKRQMAKIKREILEIPNQNGIIYGVGGVGKTALMIQLSKDLAESGTPLFSNIIWASAKTSYYNPTIDVVHEHTTRLESLDDLLQTVLYFCEFEDLEGYTLEDKKGLFLELLQENQVLLVLDNFETIIKPQKEEIIKFFEVEVKHSLRAHPNNFKIIITSRETIPCGFHSVSLTGLDLREAKQLMASLYKRYDSGHAELSDDQKEQLFRVTFGIPIVIKHAFGQIYEHRKTFVTVVESLPKVDSQQLVEFSYHEILGEIQKDGCALDTLLLLEVMNCPLMARQIADILERNENHIESTIRILANYQCVGSLNEGVDEKYSINPEIRLLTKKLTLQYPKVVQKIKYRATKNFTLEKQMDYTTEELGILTMFDEYVRSGQYLEAEKFINTELEKHSKSILLKFTYARYLKNGRHQVEKAIDILEAIRVPSHDHISVLRLLISCHLAMDIPNFHRASPYVNEVEAVAQGDDAVMLEVAEFYTRWSISMKMNKDISPDPISEMLRQQEYKLRADKALVWLNQIASQTPHILYLTAQCYYNKWDHPLALRAIRKAIASCGPNDANRPSYLYFEGLIKRTQEWYEEKGWLKMADRD
jgi:hypothetical protein